ncbi:hypothetical protein PP175_29130 (plasmid) [Aneurinibacillus sp. Ricciae_BoGa-3]|uniref:hypothetical protein n=1 Tax=Aneurinibacillus sp. Ricciae_BoGa-3 TaxID=3022697 RepID=UPI00234137E1|nr:hypothetical protein [Aneurinibacillus sp. Ricciae_BoGa-3]WCK57256.1 hypothetical protein PP175_29130 [Aneurinibacillus sp. Ricciae_BoGa-3]
MDTLIGEQLKRMENQISYIHPDKQVNYASMLGCLKKYNPNLTLGSMDSLSFYYKRILMLRLIHHSLNDAVNKIKTVIKGDTKKEAVLDDFLLSVRAFCVENVDISSGRYEKDEHFFYQQQVHSALFLNHSLTSLILENFFKVTV